jgi:EpsI family protein
LGKISKKRISIATVCLLTVSVFIYGIPSNGPQYSKKAQLGHALSNLNEWQKSIDIPLEKNVRQALRLDDYVFRQYINGEDILTLYIGYYNSIQKVGAAHDPLVCFPGQGWVLSEGSRQQLTIPIEGGTIERVNYKSMLAERPVHKELIVYWFQSYDKTTTSTFFQKILLLINRIRNHGEDNAFVRISIAINTGKDTEETINVAKKFMMQFYPQFLDFITGRTS